MVSIELEPFESISAKKRISTLAGIELTSLDFKKQKKCFGNFQGSNPRPLTQKSKKKLFIFIRIEPTTHQ